MDIYTARDILSRVTYKDWTFEVRHGHREPSLPDGLEIRCSFFDPEEGRQNGRWWVVSRYAVKSEVVTTALKAVLTAEEHEAREQFRYKGAKIFGPHLDVDALVPLAKSMSNLDIREAATV